MHSTACRLLVRWQEVQEVLHWPLLRRHLTTGDTGDRADRVVERAAGGNRPRPAGAARRTFMFHDVTGIEYNSGMHTGVLEVLTPSYQGSANKDFWRGKNRSRNAGLE